MKNKTVLKAMYLFNLILLICPNVMAAKIKSPRNTPGTAIFVMADMNQITIESKQLNYDDEGLKLSMQVPQLHGLKDSQFERSLNTKLLKDAKNRKKQMIEEAKAYNQDMAKDGLPLVPFEYIESFSIISSLKPYYTIEFFKYQYSGGAHGLSNLNYIILNTDTTQFVELKNLFKEKVNYIAIINDYIKKQIELRMQQGEYFFIGNDGFQSIKENQPFFINEKGDLIIVFNVYEIAPYVAGPIFITIPYKDLLPYMK